ncbi:MAG TPA: uridine kinase [Candidatus Nanopelagicales bacterium]|nr:uridine kinase [Candidatus Nanopelagicales bacterium]
MTARVVLLAGPSGSGKSHLAARSGLPVFRLDDFYKDADDPTLPLSTELGIADWDHVDAWHRDRAVAALTEVCSSGSTEVPTYDISLSRATGTSVFRCGGAPAVVAEGVFAAEIVDACRDAGMLADAVVLLRAPWTNFVRRLARDLAEHRKPPLTLVRRGRLLMHQEGSVVAAATGKGCRPVTARELDALLRALASTSPTVPE